MARNNVLWLDVDGVLLDWVRPFLAYINSPVSYDKLKEYDLSSLFAGGKEEMIREINMFNATEAYANLLPLIDVSELKKLKLKGYDLRIITQVDGTYSRGLRAENLDKTFGKHMFSAMIFTGRDQKKVDVLKSMGGARVVEDNPQFFRDISGLTGFYPMAVRHTYNAKELKDFPTVPIYTDMREIVRHLTNE